MRRHLKFSLLNTRNVQQNTLFRYKIIKESKKKTVCFVKWKGVKSTWTSDCIVLAGELQYLSLNVIKKWSIETKRVWQFSSNDVFFTKS